MARPRPHAPAEEGTWRKRGALADALADAIQGERAHALRHGAPLRLGAADIRRRRLLCDGDGQTMGGYCNGYGMPRRRSCGAATASRSATGRARAATSSPRSGGSTPRGSAACARSRRSASAARRATRNRGHRRARARVTAVAATVVAGSRSRSAQSARPPPKFRGGGGGRAAGRIARKRSEHATRSRGRTDHLRTIGRVYRCIA